MISIRRGGCGWNARSGARCPRRSSVRLERATLARTHRCRLAHFSAARAAWCRITCLECYFHSGASACGRFATDHAWIRRRLPAEISPLTNPRSWRANVHRSIKRATVPFQPPSRSRRKGRNAEISNGQLNIAHYATPVSAFDNWRDAVLRERIIELWNSVGIIVILQLGLGRRVSKVTNWTTQKSTHWYVWKWRSCELLFYRFFIQIWTINREIF